jgi:hypothetical protein
MLAAASPSPPIHNEAIVMQERCFSKEESEAILALLYQAFDLMEKTEYRNGRGGVQNELMSTIQMVQKKTDI